MYFIFSPYSLPDISLGSLACGTIVKLSLQSHIICALAIPMLAVIGNCNSGFGVSYNDMMFLRNFVKIGKMIEKLKP